MCKHVAEAEDRSRLLMTHKGTVHTRIAPTARRRTVLKLLAGTIAGAGLSGLGARFAFAAEPPVPVGDAVMSLEFDSSLHSRVVARQGSASEPLTDFEPGEVLRFADGKRIDAFPFLDQRSEGVEDVHGRGTRHLLRGLAGEGIEKRIGIVLYDRFPGLSLLSVTYRNEDAEPARIE